LRQISGYSGSLLAWTLPVGKPTVYADALTRAALAVGGDAQLAAALDVPVAEVRQWLSGKAYPSTEIYQKALDLLIGTGSH
jgi:hypothetical protein